MGIFHHGQVQQDIDITMIGIITHATKDILMFIACIAVLIKNAMTVHCDLPRMQ